jgi:hypothetical protein
VPSVVLDAEDSDGEALDVTDGTTGIVTVTTTVLRTGVGVGVYVTSSLELEGVGVYDTSSVELEGVGVGVKVSTIVLGTIEVSEVELAGGGPEYPDVVAGDV